MYRLEDIMEILLSSFSNIYIYRKSNIEGWDYPDVKKIMCSKLYNLFKTKQNSWIDHTNQSCGCNRFNTSPTISVYNIVEKSLTCVRAAKRTLFASLYSRDSLVAMLVLADDDDEEEEEIADVGGWFRWLWMLRFDSFVNLTLWWSGIFLAMTFKSSKSDVKDPSLLDRWSIIDDEQLALWLLRRVVGMLKLPPVGPPGCCWWSWR